MERSNSFISLALLFIFTLALKIQHLHGAISKNVKDDCGKTKGCLFKPDDCTPFVNCAYFMSYSNNDSTVTMELLTQLAQPASQNQWVAAGYSADTSMGDDTVFFCVFSNENQQPRVGLAYNNGKSNAVISADNSAVRPIEGGVIDNAYLCRLTTNVRVNTNDQRIRPLNNNYNILLASGIASAPSTLNMHTTNRADAKFPYVSGSVNVTDSTLYSAAPVAAGSCVSDERAFNLIKAHGILMIFGWWMFVATAILFARYFRSSWPTRKIFDTLLWFNFHRGLNTLGVLMIASGFICIFVSQCGVWIGGDFPKHAITGMTACICAFVQPIVAALRCHPGTSKRPIFNWVHRTIGLGGFCCACATIYFARYFDGLGLSPLIYGTAPLGIMIFYWVSLVVVVVALELLITISERIQRRKVTNEMQMQGLKGEPSTEGTGFISKPLWNASRMFLLSLFVLIALAVCITLSCFIGLGS